MEARTPADLTEAEKNYLRALLKTLAPAQTNIVHMGIGGFGEMQLLLGALGQAVTLIGGLTDQMDRR